MGVTKSLLSQDSPSLRRHGRTLGPSIPPKNRRKDGVTQRCKCSTSGKFASFGPHRQAPSLIFRSYSGKFHHPAMSAVKHGVLEVPSRMTGSTQRLVH
jgi:hypothetical protein